VLPLGLLTTLGSVVALLALPLVERLSPELDPVLSWRQNNPCSVVVSKRIVGIGRTWRLCVGALFFMPFMYPTGILAKSRRSCSKSVAAA
jgi:hypothetical protein